jgi:hypothetical protein
MFPKSEKQNADFLECPFSDTGDRPSEKQTLTGFCEQRTRDVRQ